MTLTEITARLPEFRALWVEKLLDAETVGKRFGLTDKAVFNWAARTGLNVERKNAIKARGIKRPYRKRERRTYVPPHGNCRECELLQACIDYRTWLMDAGLPCETLLPDEAAAVANGGYERSELPRRTAMEVILHYEI